MFGGSGASRTVTVTPAAAQAGTATITITVSDASGAPASEAFVLTVTQPTTVQPPTAFHVSAMSGGLVTFRFTPSAVGPPATGFVIEGGILVGQVLASLATPDAAPIFTALVPNGSFYARVHATRGSERSAASNEIRLHVNVPVAPSSPDLFSSTVNGSNVVSAVAQHVRRRRAGRHLARRGRIGVDQLRAAADRDLRGQWRAVRHLY